MKPITTIFCTAAMAWLASSNTYACSCKLASAEANAPQATVVFKGVVTEEIVDPANKNEYRALFRPTTIYKGDQATAITVHTRGDQGSCGVRFAKGSEHMVFAFQSGQRLRTSLCNTWPISKSYASHTAEVESHFNRRK
ncbi:hypothetical protein LJR038_004449 [Acidovorax sp. LjRoot38]|uniref:hypothetical protein n=1 Tax=Acidovorax sp. LjRoot38 TaxID=3342327 RepID=UPI003ECCE44D